jgi:hypothetical protein
VRPRAGKKHISVGIKAFQLTKYISRVFVARIRDEKCDGAVARAARGDGASEDSHGRRKHVWDGRRREVHERLRPRSSRSALARCVVCSDCVAVQPADGDRRFAVAAARQQHLRLVHVVERRRGGDGRDDITVVERAMRVKKTAAEVNGVVCKITRDAELVLESPRQRGDACFALGDCGCCYTSRAINALRCPTTIYIFDD